MTVFRQTRLLLVLPSLRDGFTGERSELEAPGRKVRLPLLYRLVNFGCFCAQASTSKDSRQNLDVAHFG